jgi:molybdopterin/thiamine biosynthesis adenylyltransferase
MSSYGLTLQRKHVDELTVHLIRPDGNEHAAYLLCNRAEVRHDPWDRCPHTGFVCAKVIPVPDDHVLVSTPNVVTWKTASFVSALREAEANDQVVAIVHNHPAGMAEFSVQDDANEPDLVQLAVNRNGSGTRMLSMILTADGQFTGRVWLHPRSGSSVDLRAVRVAGDRFEHHYFGRSMGRTQPAFQRQALAFGDALNQDLRKLRVSIVGCGGTGSAVAMLLARLGVGQIALIDNDIVDQSNLNRLHGARQADADAMIPKVDVVARSITELGLGARVTRFEAWVGDPDCRDVLKSSDIIFGCTDDHSGRLFLNRLAYFYLIPVIDIGLAIQADEGQPPQLNCLDGRVTVLAPGGTCLLCRDVIIPTVATSEALRRSDPQEYERRKAEAYVVGEGNPSPAVVTFTTELACMAVNEMIHRMQGFRGRDGSAANRVRKFHLLEDRRPGHKPRAGCPVCASDQYWGRGDMNPFLGMVT